MFLSRQGTPTTVPRDRNLLDNPANPTVRWTLFPVFMSTGADKKGHFLATAETPISERDFENQFYGEFGLPMNMGRFHEAGDQLYCGLHRSAIPMCRGGEYPRIPSS